MFQDYYNKGANKMSCKHDYAKVTKTIDGEILSKEYWHYLCTKCGKYKKKI